MLEGKLNFEGVKNNLDEFEMNKSRNTLMKAKVNVKM